MIVLSMAWRNVWRNKIRSLIIICSVSLGLVAGLLVLSMYKGIMSDRVRDVIDREVSHLQLHHPAFKEDFDSRFVIPAKEKVLDRVEAMNTVSSYAVRTLVHAMVASPSGSSGLTVIGVDPERENIVSGLNSKIRTGQGFASSKKNPIIIGRKLAEKLHLKENAKVILTFTDAESNIVSAAFRISGIYETNNAPNDERFAYVKQKDLNAQIIIGDACHEIAILLKTDDDVESARAQLAASFPDLQIETWEELSSETKLMLDTTEEYSSIFITIIMIALSFGIVNSMLMAVLERSREIGMLLALGMNRVRIFSLMLFETLLLTLTGAPAGVMITWIVVRRFHERGIDISSFGGEAMSSFGFSSVIHLEFPYETIISEMVIVVAAALLSSLIPAIKAIRLHPVAALQK